MLQEGRYGQLVQLKAVLDSIGPELLPMLTDEDMYGLIRGGYHMDGQLQCATEQELQSVVSAGTANLLYSRLHPGRQAESHESRNLMIGGHQNRPLPGQMAIANRATVRRLCNWFRRLCNHTDETHVMGRLWGSCNWGQQLDKRPQLLLQPLPQPVTHTDHTFQPASHPQYLQQHMQHMQAHQQPQPAKSLLIPTHTGQWQSSGSSCLGPSWQSQPALGQLQQPPALSSWQVPQGHMAAINGPSNQLLFNSQANTPFQRVLQSPAQTHSVAAPQPQALPWHRAAVPQIIMPEMEHMVLQQIHALEQQMNSLHQQLHSRQLQRQQLLLMLQPPLQQSVMLFQSMPPQVIPHQLLPQLVQQHTAAAIQSQTAQPLPTQTQHRHFHVPAATAAAAAAAAARQQVTAAEVQPPQGVNARMQLQPELQQVPIQQQDATRMQHPSTSSGFKRQQASGQLERMPDAWLQQCIRCLPASSKLALFRVSRQCAQHVINNTARAVLRLVEVNKEDESPSVSTHQHLANIEARCSVLLNLIEGCHRFEVELSTEVYRPCPASDRITALKLCLAPGHQTLYLRHNSRRQFSIQWSKLRGLCTLDIDYGIYREDLKELCEALEAGNLPHLHRFRLGLDRDEPSQLRLAGLLGQQITDLTIRSGLWGRHDFLKPTGRSYMTDQLVHFSVLQSVALYDCWIASSVMQHLCELSTLQTVTLGGNLCIEGDHSQHVCMWKTICLHAASAHVLAVLPLASVEDIRISYKVRMKSDSEDAPTPDVQVLSRVLEQYPSKLSCVPDVVKDDGSFTLLPNVSSTVAATGKLCVSYQMQLQLVPFLKGVNTLVFDGSEFSYHLRVSSRMLPQPIWEKLPKVVQCVVFCGSNDLGDPTEFWRTVPATLSHVKLVGCCYIFRDADWLKEWVMAAPSHIRKVTLGKQEGGWASEFYETLLLLAPAHLTVRMSSWN